MKPSDAFIDEATLTVIAGDGGDGLVGFRREKFVPRGGPDGGDGGHGGDVVLVGDRNLATLRDQRYRREIRAGGGGDGGSNQRSGAAGEDAFVRVPVGTLIHDAAAPDAAPPLADLVEDGQRVVVARGGRGGWGNARFATSTRQTPDFARSGTAGERRQLLRLSLKLLADVGLVGLPNAGKSTLLRRLSSARPRVGDYPFTTLFPCLGVAEHGERRFVIADLPGLIEGASEGIGLGDRFLRHVERTRVLVHVLDAGRALLEERDLLAEYETVRRELGCYDARLLEREEVVVLNKIDLLPDRKLLDAVEADLRARGRSVFRVSGATSEGVAQLIPALARILDAADRPTATCVSREAAS